MKDYKFITIKVKKKTKDKLKKYCKKNNEMVYSIVDKALEEYYINHSRKEVRYEGEK